MEFLGLGFFSEQKKQFKDVTLAPKNCDDEQFCSHFIE